MTPRAKVAAISDWKNGGPQGIRIIIISSVGTSGLNLSEATFIIQLVSFLTYFELAMTDYLC